MWTTDAHVRQVVLLRFARAPVVLVSPPSAISTISRKVRKVTNYKYVHLSCIKNKKGKRSTEACTPFSRMLPVHQDFNSTVLGLQGRTRLDVYFISAYSSQSRISCSNTLLYTHRHVKLYHGCTRGIVCTCTSCLLVRVIAKAICCQISPRPMTAL